MSSCLYDCLCEARLEQYYTHFTAMGFLKSQELVKLTMNDYSSLGIHNMHDRKRLFQLIQIIKAVEEEERDHTANMEHTQANSDNLNVEKVKLGPRRQLDFDSLSSVNGVPTSSGYPKLSSCVNQQIDAPSGLLKFLSPVDQLSAKFCLKDTQSLPGRETGHPTVLLPNHTRDCNTDEIQNTRMILHIAGYNYGLPRAAIRHTNHVKEQTWTELEKIHVCVRKRPLRVREIRRGEIDIAKVEGEKSILVCEKKEAVDLTHYLQQHVFYFDEVFEETCTNHDVYLKTAYPLIQHIFNGGKAACFAYGQTGAGKTHTMIGTYRNPGLYALAAEDIFIHLQTSEPCRALFIWISFYEIYCGQLYDLLNGRKRLFAREDGNHVVQIVGLHEICVEGVKSLLEVISWGSKARSTGASGINTDSSRSHAVIQIQLKDPAETVVGRISFIDLAGSERAADARDSDKHAKLEGAEINQSLLALKECIRALDQEHAHTPFRQSRLTLVLKDSFIGNSKTCMIANISPSHMATDHTLNTLRYADRVKEIKRGAKTSSVNLSRCQGGRSPSPKQTKACGDKSVPKKVKPRIEQSQYSDKNATQPKFSPVVLRQRNNILCSTPRMSGKNVFSPTTSKLMWQSHSTPLKGLFKKKPSDASKNTTDEGPNGKGIITKEAFLSKSRTPRRMQHGQINKNVKVQAVHPIQKEVIPRDGFHFTGQTKNYSPNKENSNKIFESEYQKSPKSPENEPFPQKEREKHLRLYHQQLQQLQQPPLLQKKLTYQPLKELLRQFYQHKIEMSNKENGHASSLESTVQKSDVQTECSYHCDPYSVCQSMDDTQNQTCNHNLFYEIERVKGENGGNTVQVFHSSQDQSCNPRREDGSFCGSPWSTEECTIHCSSGDHATEMLCSQNDSDNAQMKPRYLTFDSKNSLQNYSADDQDDNCPISKISQMDNSFPFAADLKSVKIGTNILFQSSNNMDLHLNSVTEVAKNEQVCKISGNMILSTDCTSEDLMNVSDTCLSMERPLSQNTHLTDQRMAISCNQYFAEMEEFPTDSDKNQKLPSDDLFVSSKSASHYQHLILTDGTEKQTVAKDETDHCSYINCVEPTYKDVSTNDCTGFLNSPNHDLKQDRPLCASLSGKLPSKAISQTSECHNYRQEIKCLNIEPYDSGTEETVFNPSILHLHLGVMSIFEAVASEAGNQSTTDLHLNQVSRQKGTSNCGIASSKITEPMNISQIKESQEKNEVLVARSCTEGMLDNHHNEDGFQPCCKSIDKDLIKEELLHNTLNHLHEEDNSIPMEAFVNRSENKFKACGLVTDGNQSKHLIARHLETMEKSKKLVVQSHCEQLEEMLALFEKEEYLLNKLMILDFNDYVTQLEELLMLKARSIQHLQGEIHKYQIPPRTKQQFNDPES
ncbi:kinesin-like protein KIF24 isoform X2 [Hypanus sabinus]|uniref:kinesin-like protein KIF24 isoform X2 n=1 Tax=Hypanus sabinus TaxID=79690 RepID=UPI0028C49F21|nr:kinesin-like protein KIF24 isoform X2 [Hypanus sabinus]